MFDSYLDLREYLRRYYLEAFAFENDDDLLAKTFPFSLHLDLFYGLQIFLIKVFNFLWSS